MADLLMSRRDKFFPWPRAGTPPLARARLRVMPEDFHVEELIDFPLSGSGEHLWLYVEKRGHNTDRAARMLARVFGLSPSAVRFAGLKDRHAVTRQYFSLHQPRGEPPAPGAVAEGLVVLSATRHTRALRRGAAAANRFRLTLRACEADRLALPARLATIANEGVPNYFGPQRFGHGGENIERARAMFAGECVRDRHLRSLYLSAARAFLFNEVLAARMRANCWDRPQPGDAFMLDGKNSFFLAETIDAEIDARLARHDIHLSGPLWGKGVVIVRDAVARLEQSVIGAHADLAAGLAAADLRQERRALRVLPRDLGHRWLDDQSLELCFTLPGGSYATALVSEIAADDG